MASSRAGRSQGMCRQGSPPAPTPSFAPDMPSSSNSRWSELPVPSSRTHVSGTRARRAAPAARPPRAGAATGAGERSQKAGRRRPRPATGEAQPRAPAACPAGSERHRAQVVRRAGVQALLRAGGHEPHVAAGPSAAEPPGQRDQHGEAGGVVLRAGAPGAESVWAITIRRQSAACRAPRSRFATARAPAPGRAGRRRAGPPSWNARHIPVRPGLGGARGGRAPSPRSARQSNRVAGRGDGQQRQESSRSSSSGSVTGALQAKRSHTYAAARPSTG